MFRQERRERRPVALISHQVYHTGKVECYKCASHDMQARDVPAPPARSLRLPRPRTEAVAFLNNGKSIVQVSVLINLESSRHGCPPMTREIKSNAMRTGEY